ncbi:response regulator transcription factor [soil metagenome]
MLSGNLKDGKIRVLLADDHAMFRQGIREMISTDACIEVVGEAENGREAVALAGDLLPDVVLLDIEMPVMDAQGVIGQMLDVSPPPKVVIVTMYDDPRLVRELIGLGAVAYLVKSATIEELLRAVHNAMQSPIGPGENAVTIAPPDAFAAYAGSNSLSERELEVLLMVARGMSNHQISGALHISEATVKRHLANIYPKMYVSSRGEAVRKALQESWITIRDITVRESTGTDSGNGNRR